MCDVLDFWGRFTRNRQKFYIYGVRAFQAKKKVLTTYYFGIAANNRAKADIKRKGNKNW